MKILPNLAAAIFLASTAFAQQGTRADAEPTILLPELLREAVLSNPDIAAARAGVDAARGRTRRAGTLSGPELTYQREQMPGFRWKDAGMEKVELMQAIPFPSRLSGENAAARFIAESEKEASAETVNDILGEVSQAYVALWYASESLRLNSENQILLNRFLEAARTRYGVGSTNIQDVLKASIELAAERNERAGYTAEEEAARARLAALLGKPDTVLAGVAVLPDSLEILPSSDTLEALAFRARPMLRRDSLMAEADREMADVARTGYLPDLRLGVMYMTAPAGDFRGWGFSAGISLPFAPWSVGGAAGTVEEREANWRQSREQYASRVARTLAGVRELHASAGSRLTQLDAYRAEILPAAGQALQASLIAYQTGETDILSLLDSFRTYLRLQQEAVKARAEYERTKIELERTVGLLAARTLAAERLLP